MSEADLAMPLLSQLPVFGLLDAVDDALRTGTVTLDTTQYEYLLALMSAPQRTMPAPGSATPTIAARQAPGAAAQREASTSATSALRPDAATLRSLVSAVKDVLPDYGDGYVEACLQVSGWDSAAAVNNLLTGELPAELAALDRSAATNPLARDALRGAGGAVGAGPTQASEGARGGYADGLSWAQTRGPDLAAQRQAEAAQRLQPDAAKGKSSKYAGACCNFAPCHAFCVHM